VFRPARGALLVRAPPWPRFTVRVVDGGRRPAANSLGPPPPPRAGRGARDAERASADAERASADAARASADVERARADAAEKRAFVAKLDGIAASGSESSPADVERRGAPAPVTADEGAVALGMPALEEAEARASWARYVADHAPAPAAAGAPRAVEEVRDVQPVVARLSRCAAGAAAGQLRVWLGKEASDDNAAAAASPDQVWTHARDAAPSMIGALVIVEVKKPGGLRSAVAQAAKYLRRRVAALFHEADARGESGHDIFSVAAATDGHSLALLRMASGAPENGDFRDACPCPVLVTEPLPLLPGFSFAAEDAQAPPRDPPPGFLALARVLRAPLAALGGAQPLSQLRVTLAGGAAATLRFGARLGSGGASDVYALQAEAGSHFAGACAKVPRFTTAAVDAQFRRESAVLAELAPLEGACVPRLLCDAQRDGAAAAHLGRCRWPLLVIAPAGVPICAFVASLVKRERERGGPSAECALRVTDARRALADRAARCALRTLQVAHAKGRVHCDVRPANLVVLEGAEGGAAGGGDVAASAPGGAEAGRGAEVGGEGRAARGDGAVMLVDWGLSVDLRADAARRGTPAFAASAVFTQGSFVARARMDLVGVAHTWLAVAHGSDACAAPWAAASPLEPLLDTLARREQWLAEHAAEARAVAGLLQDVARPVEAASYAWPQAEE